MSYKLQPDGLFKGLTMRTTNCLYNMNVQSREDALERVRTGKLRAQIHDRLEVEKSRNSVCQKRSGDDEKKYVKEGTKDVGLRTQIRTTDARYVTDNRP